MHTSNYRIVGFSADVELGELVAIGRRHGMPVMEDLGSGALVDLSRYGLPKEPVVAERIALGADLVTFSGDKVLGGPQAGLIVGTRALVERRSSANPLHRALRCGKLTIAALEATLRLYQQSPDIVRDDSDAPGVHPPARGDRGHGRSVRCPRLRAALGDGFRVSLEDSTSQIGSGALPTEEIPTKVIAIEQRRASAPSGSPRASARPVRRSSAASRTAGSCSTCGRSSIRDDLMPSWSDLELAPLTRDVIRCHSIIGTAGHIDHGKTSLVKALTGQDTDRLKEEKERGISIDLGFAHLDLPDGTRAGVVDVPGHERFIRNMLAGAHGIDLVLFTVAADDGVMPQTEEHLDILHLLGVHARHLRHHQGRSRVTDADRRGGGGDPRADRRHVARRVADRAVLVRDRRRPRAASRADRRDGCEPVRRRRPTATSVCRSTARSSLQGHGLVVTGTAVSGEVRVGDTVRCLPGGRAVARPRRRGARRIRSTSRRAGQRVALNLSGSNDAADRARRRDLRRDDHAGLRSFRCACSRCGRQRRAGIKNHQRVRVHLGTAERLGTVILLGSPENPTADSIGAGETAYCQIALSEPLHVAAWRSLRPPRRDRPADARRRRRPAFPRPRSTRGASLAARQAPRRSIAGDDTGAGRGR